MTWRARFQLAGLLMLVFVLAGCYLRDAFGSAVRPPRGVEARDYVVITTGYCPCKECCTWHRNWYGRPTFSSGPNKGERKVVGQTASGTMARPGTLAADTDIFPFGTIIHIPGYGYGRVEDRGGDIKGYHLDLFYRTHERALEHGRYKERVRVWFPPGYAPKK